MRFLTSIGLSILLTAILGGCSTAPPIVSNTPQQQRLYQQHLNKIASIKQFSLKGRIAVNTKGKGYSGGLTWVHNPESDKLEMFSPLGSKVSEITKNSVEVVLISSDGKHFNAIDAETLTQNTLGWRLPLSGLVDWIVGHPATAGGPATDITLDEFGRIMTLKQDGWDIEYAQYNDNNSYFLPSKITLRSPKVNLKLVVEQWNGINAQQPLKPKAESAP